MKKAKMKILGINGSQRKEGNSYILLKSALEGAREENESLIETEILQLRDFKITPCEAHYSGLYEEKEKNWGCGKKPYKCILNDDFEKVFQKMIKADGIIISSPFYYPVPSRLAALIERLMAIAYFAKNTDKNYVFPLAGKPFGAIANSHTSSNIIILKILRSFGFFAKMRLVREAKNKVFGVDVRGGVERNPKSLKKAKKLGSLVTKILIKKQSENGVRPIF